VGTSDKCPLGAEMDTSQQATVPGTFANAGLLISNTSTPGFVY
jgi:hypothetical protein